ncbi:MAG: glycosyltransferase [Alphaproteobacteria bacterium]|jgi:glycosyltransferase involved in cell wall biosynthesis|nr:glycosyltransferase [Alphaproteobacteria bacterium]
MNKKVIYTAIVGGYDIIPEIKYRMKGWDYILFSDSVDKGTFKGWKVKPLQSNVKPDIDYKTKSARWHKTHPHKLFPDYKYSIWIDSNISVENDTLEKKVEELINKEIKISSVKHPDRKCSYKEIKACFKFGKDTFSNLRKVKSFLKKEKLPKDMGSFETGLMFREHNNTKIQELDNLWWSLIEKYSKRDQLTFPYSLWKSNIECHKILGENHSVRNHKGFKIINHKVNNKKVKPIKRFRRFLIKIRLKRYQRLLKVFGMNIINSQRGSNLKYFALCFKIWKAKIKKQGSIILIKSTYPDDKRRLNCGDLYLAEDLCKGMSIDGNKAFPVPLNYWSRGLINKLSNYSIVFRGLFEMDFSKLSRDNHYMYLISHPEDVMISEMKNYKGVFVASKNYAEDLRKVGVNAFYVPQFTNPNKFKEEKDDNFKHDILFVGNTRQVYREIVKMCIDNNINVDVYGKGWKKFIPAENYKGKFIKNTDLAKHYCNSKIVLNDHWDDMKRYGFVSNRIFDATACGSFIISDHINEIEENYKGNVVTYKTEKEFVDKINFFLNNEKDRKAKAKAAKEITLKEFTEDRIGKKMLDIIKSS